MPRRYLKAFLSSANDSLFARNDFFEDPLPDRDPLTPEAFVLQSSLAALIDQVTAQVPDLDLQQQRHAISLPPFV